MKNIEVSLVIPVYNSGGWLADLVAECHQVLKDDVGSGRFEIILVNDCSPNGDVVPCLNRLKAQFEEVKAFNLALNAGQFKATIFGFTQCLGEYVLTMDDDYQHSPSHMPLLLNALRKSADVHCAIARLQNKSNSFFRRIGSGVFRQVLKLAGKKLPKGFKSSSFRALRKELVVGVCRYQSRNPVLGPVLLTLTNNVVNVDVPHGKRIAGESGYSIRRLLSGFLSSYLTLSTAPLRMTFVLGLLSFLFSAFISIWYLGRYFTLGVKVPGYTSQILATAFFGGVSTLSIAIVGEYISFLIREVTGPSGVVTQEEFECTGEDD